MVLPYTALFFFIILLFSKSLMAKPQNASTPRIPAAFVFGDSIVDTGNNNLLNTLNRCNFPPYGKDFPSHQPTGRFSNGRVPSDLIASYLRIKELLPAYLDPNLHPEELLTGVSFASGGSGFDPTTNTVTNTLSPENQLEMFREYKAKIRGIAGVDRAAAIVKDSLYVVCSGSNDLGNTYFNDPFRRTQYDLPSYVKQMVHSASAFLKSLHSEGARKIAILGLPPLGCLPIQRTLYGGPARACFEALNEAPKMFNNDLEKEVRLLSGELTGTKILYVDIYTLLYDLFQRPTHYGFEVATRGCCGTGTIESTMTCNSLLMVTTCEDSTKYVFWDAIHPTETAYKILIEDAARKYIHLLLD